MPFAEGVKWLLQLSDFIPSSWYRCTVNVNGKIAAATVESG